MDAVSRRGMLTQYDRGATTVYALRADPRFCFCLYVPPEFQPTVAELLVVVHGSYRNFTAHRDQFGEFARTNGCLVLAPLFPVGILGDGNGDGFKYLIEGDIRYDRVLEAMVEEVRERWGLKTEKFGLVGFSGGAQFTNRYLILHPRRLWAASVGAPGSVTLLDSSRAWWVGIADFETRFGHPVDIAALRETPVQLIVGDRDLDPSEITHMPGSRHWQDGANDAGKDRVERIGALNASLSDAGLSVTLSLLPGVGHKAEPIFAASQIFLAEQLKRYRAQHSPIAAPAP